MNRDEIHKAVTSFLSLLEGGNVDSETREETLKLALDRLALAYHFAECIFDEADYPDAPAKDYGELRKTISILFPDYGYYNTASHISVRIGEAEVWTGDAIDDITDIALDMFVVLWLWENTSIENALWEFRSGYDYHWAMHLRCLQLYLLANNQSQ